MLNGVKIKCKKLYKKILVYLYSKMYPLPVLDNNLHKSEKIYKINIGSTLYKLYELKNSRVWTNKNDVTAYITKENFLSKASFQYKKFDLANSKNQNLSKNLVLKNGTTNFLKKVEGNVLSLLSGGASRTNFTHWLSDVIPRLFIYLCKFDINTIDKIYVPSLNYKFQIESLALLGIKKNKLISAEKYKHLYAKKIFATSHPCFHDPKKIKKWSLISLQKKFINKNHYKDDTFSKIFIIRDDKRIKNNSDINKFSSARILINENEIKKYLSSLNFFIIKPENHSFKDQIKIFNSAQYVVGFHGAAMMMITFCKKKTNIIEIKPRNAGNEFLNISQLINLNHEQINLNPVKKSKIIQNGIINCSTKLIETKLKKLGFKDF